MSNEKPVKPIQNDAAKAKPAVKPAAAKKKSKKSDGLVLGSVTMDKVDFKGDTIQHVLNITETVTTNLRKGGKLQVISTVVKDKVISELVLV